MQTLSLPRSCGILALVAFVSLALISLPTTRSASAAPIIKLKFGVEITSPSVCHDLGISKESVRMSARVVSNILPPSTVGHFYWYIDGKYAGEGNPITRTVSYTPSQQTHTFVVNAYDLSGTYIGSASFAYGVCIR
jgi:hypothetical protein